jgi:hypothetical protein
MGHSFIPCGSAEPVDDYKYSVRHPTVIICKMLGAERAFLVERSGMGSPAVMESKALARGFVDSQVRKPGPGAAVGCF